jgi:hypothetical protein
MTPDIRSDPQYDEPVNIEMEPEEALPLLLANNPTNEPGEDSEEMCE